jgi:hypothetical protein
MILLLLAGPIVARKPVISRSASDEAIHFAATRIALLALAMTEVSTGGCYRDLPAVFGAAMFVNGSAA